MALSENTHDLWADLPSAHDTVLPKEYALIEQRLYHHMPDVHLVLKGDEPSLLGAELSKGQHIIHTLFEDSLATAALIGHFRTSNTSDTRAATKTEATLHLLTLFPEPRHRFHAIVALASNPKAEAVLEESAKHYKALSQVGEPVDRLAYLSQLGLQEELELHGMKDETPDSVGWAANRVPGRGIPHVDRKRVQLTHEH